MNLKSIYSLLGTGVVAALLLGACGGNKATSKHEGPYPEDLGFKACDLVDSAAVLAAYGVSGAGVSSGGMGGSDCTIVIDKPLTHLTLTVFAERSTAEAAKTFQRFPHKDAARIAGIGDETVTWVVDGTAHRMVKTRTTNLTLALSQIEPTAKDSSALEAVAKSVLSKLPQPPRETDGAK